jgi:AraC-like DNA-binding protein/quercetin dioxygenase-like cupin family protein
MINTKLLEKLSAITPEEERLLSGNPVDREIYMKENTSVVNSEKLLESGKLITLRPHVRFVDFPPHSHDYIEMVYMCKGSTEHNINGKELLLCEGDILFLAKNAIHSIKSAKADDIAINLIILPEFFCKCVDIMGDQDAPLKRFIIDALHESPSECHYLHFKVSDLLPIQNLMENLIWTITSEVPNKNSINQTTMGLLLLHLVNNTQNLQCASNEQSNVLKVIRYIEQNYTSATLTEAAELINSDIYKLSRELKSMTGKTFTDILQEKRLSQAAYLLCSTSMKIDDIANSVGYYNLTFFYRTFSERYGLSPRKYRVASKSK